MLCVEPKAIDKPNYIKYYNYVKYFAILILLWSVWEIFTYPVNQDFPYRFLLPLLAISSFGLIWLQLRVLRAIVMERRGKLMFSILLAILAFSTAGCYGMWIWANRQVSKITYPYQSSSAPSNDFLVATVAMEDGNFYRHNGVDWVALHRALRVDVQEGRIKQGGSTITQQLAKNLFLSDERTGLRKFCELFLTFALESRFSKSEILLLYTHSIYYGMGQHGIDAAANYYYKKSPRDLTLVESALLVGLVPHNPQRWPNCDSIEKGRNTALARIEYWFPHSYSKQKLLAAGRTPLRDLLNTTQVACSEGALKREVR